MRVLAAVVMFVALTAGCGSVAAPGVTRPTPATATPAPTGIPSALHQVSDPGQLTGKMPALCTFRRAQALPDPACTPGAYDPQVTAARLCAPGYSTRTYRAPASQTTPFKYDQAYPAYGLAKTTVSELDHLVPLELGGANDASNLWPEPGKIPNAKDAVENALHDWVCAATGATAQLRLSQAQVAIAVDWQHAEINLGVPQ